jgi:hypothetical protein
MLRDMMRGGDHGMISYREERHFRALISEGQYDEEGPSRFPNTMVLKRYRAHCYSLRKQPEISYKDPRLEKQFKVPLALCNFLPQNF